MSGTFLSPSFYLDNLVFSFVYCRAVSEGLGDTEPHDIEQLEKESDELSEADKLLLDAYHRSWDDSKVDLELVLALLHLIHSGKREGKRFMHSYNEIFYLNSSKGKV